ncbi:MAG: UvrD-helicase domain-containing protein [Gallibacter sp.]|nr:UvrD-helicase domain-containing protein [Gallibacter sp.]
MICFVFIKLLFFFISLNNGIIIAMKYLNNLNEKQREAVLKTEGALLILAGAGSGKTSTMTRRIAYLIDEKKVDPYQILAVTFTNKAANEMRERVESLVDNTNGMWIMTFHATALRMLRTYADRLGFTKSFVVYDPSDQKAVVKNIIKENNVNEKNFPVRNVLSAIGKYKEEGVSPTKAQEMAGDYREETLAKIYAGYCSVLKKNDAMDFDDLLSNVVKLLKSNEDVLDHYQERFRYIMVDEYQDTNKIQYQFIKLLASKYNNICVVGDDDQCIYEWRGADISNILSFEKDFKDALVIKLEQNYRSTGNILDAAHSVISKNISRKSKKLWTEADRGEKITYLRFDADKAEALFVVSEIASLIDNGCDASDIAILYRNNAQSRVFEDALTRRGIAYRVMGGVRYYDRAEVKDMVAYMRLVLNPKDDLAFARVINSPKRGIGKATLEKWRALADIRGVSLLETIDDPMLQASMSAKVRESVENFVALIKGYNQEKENIRVTDLYNGLLIKSGYMKFLESQGSIEADSRIENLLEFKTAIDDIDGEQNLELFEFLEKITLLSDIDNHDASENAVVLMTMHSAKGLEFPYVFMPGMEDGLFPGWRALERPDGIEEERRLCYVGMTRAKKKLYLTSTAYRVLYGNGNYTRESQFLREVDAKLLDGDRVLNNTRDAQFGERKSFDGFASGDEFNPFATFRKAKQEAKKQASSSLNLSVGNRVAHSKFGDGTVKEVDAKIVVVNFDNGDTKKLAISMAPLKIIG